MASARKSKAKSRAKTKARAKRVTARGKAPKGARIRANYDAASDGKDNLKHWENADSLAANVLNDPETRQRLRDRSRFEARNNCHFYGLIESLANDLVGTGPRLQLTIPGVSRDVTRQIENAWRNWAEAADLAEDLRLLHRTRVRDGEAFAMLIDNPALPASGRTPLTLDLAIYEAEQVADPFYWAQGLDPTYDDGIRRDAAGNPIEYTFLKNHPGGVAGGWAYDTEKFPAARIIHWVKCDRPGQARGVPMLTPGLNLGAQIRRYGLAVLGAAETAANFAGIMKSTAPPANGDPVTIASMDEVELVRNALLTLPPGWDAVQFKPEQPAPSFKEYRTEVLSEIARPAQVPRNVVTGSSADYNFSSARADFNLYHRTIRVERSRLRPRAVDRVFLWFVAEAILARLIPEGLPPVSAWAWEWHWDGFDSVDPLKDAQTDEVELRAGTTTLADIYARKGQDWEEKIRQRARERDLLQELRLDQSVPSTPATTAAPTEGPDADDSQTPATTAHHRNGTALAGANGAGPRRRGGR